MRILLTGARAPVTLEMARRLRGQGHSVLVCDSTRFGCATLSKSCQRAVLVPAVNTSGDGYIDAVNSIIENERIDLLIPTCEEVFVLASRKQQLGCDVFLSQFDTLRQLHDKCAFSKLGSLGTMKVPETFRIQSREEMGTFRQVAEKFVFKPVFSRFAAETLIQPSGRQLDRLQVSETKPWVAQRFVKGRELSTYSVAHQGKLSAHCTYHSSFRAGLGAGVCFRAEKNTHITEFVREFVGLLGYCGQIGFDFVVGEQGTIWVLECNPRATSGLHLFENDSRIVDALIGRDQPLVEADTASAAMLGPAMLAYGFPRALIQGRCLQFLRDLTSSREVLFRWLDPMPFVGLPLTLAELCWIACRKRISLQEASTCDFEWNGGPL